MNNVVIFNGGQPLPPWVVGEIPDDAYLIAADSGLDHAHTLGIDVDMAVGDFDSAGEHALVTTDATVERHSPNKDATDLELAMAAAMRHDPLRIVILGGQGGRMDHLMGSMMLIASERWAGVEIEWVGRDARVRVIHAGVTLHGATGSIITLLAMNESARGVTTTGLEWNLDDETLELGSTRGVSNRFTGPVASVRLRSGTLVSIQPDPA